VSIATRQWVVDNLAFSRDSQHLDLLDPNLTTTALIAFLVELLHARDGAWQNGGVLVTSVRSDHPTADGPDGHQGGNAIDFVDALGAPEHLLIDVQACDAARGIGCGGRYQEFAPALGGYSPESKLFEDNNEDHIHVQVVGY
jgi:hypothetical protein